MAIKKGILSGTSNDLNKGPKKKKKKFNMLIMKCRILLSFMNWYLESTYDTKLYQMEKYY